MEYRVGTCGWSYEDWKGSLYPPGTTDELAFYATRFNAVEIDSTWYRIPSRKTVESWRQRTPEGFLLCPKLLRDITHENLLRDSEGAVRAFFDVLSGLEEKLGPVDVQLGPKFAADDFDVLAGFLRALPEGFRYVVEFRHKSWVGESRALDLLRELGMGVVMADHPWYPRIVETTTDFAYLRLLGKHGVFERIDHIQRPREERLREWAGILRGLGDDVGRVYAFINNQFEGHGPGTARRLIALLEGTEPPHEGPLQPAMEF